MRKTRRKSIRKRGLKLSRYLAYNFNNFKPTYCLSTHFLLCFFISLLERKSELEEQNQAKMEEWRATAAPVEEWLAEEGNKFDAQGVGPGASLDLVKKRREEAEVDSINCKTIY